MDLAKINEKPELQPHFLDYWRIIRLRKSLILTVFLLVVITTTAVTFWLPERFASMVRIKVEKDQPEIGVETRQFNPAWDPYFLKTEFSVIQSSSILNTVITNANLNLDRYYATQLGVESLTLDEAYSVLFKRCKVQQTPNTSLIEIWVYDSDKKMAAQIANKIAEVYRESRLDRWTATKTMGIEALKKELKLKNIELSIAQTNLDKMVVEKKIPLTQNSVFYTGTIHTERIQNLERNKQEALNVYNRDKDLLDQVMDVKEEDRRNSLPMILPIDSEFTVLSQNLSTAENKFLAVSKLYGPKNEEYTTAELLLKQAQGQMNAKIAGVVGGLKRRVDAFKATYDRLVAEYEGAVAMANAAQTDYRPYINLNRDVENLRQMVDKIESKVVAETVESKQPLTSIVTITDEARPGIRPVSPNKTMNILLGVMVGLIVGVGLAFFIEYLDTSIKTIDDVERALEAPVLAVIPQQVGVLLDEGLDSPHAEAYRVLRTNLLFARKDESWNTITVLSAGAGEGKSTTLFNLATVFAQNGSRTLVIDSDLCRPSVHKILRVSNSLGLTDYLLKQSKLEDVIQTTSQPNLHFMPSGKLPRTSMGVLSSVQMKAMIKELKQRYDFVFFDSPPLLGVSDASVLASQMDMILQVIQYRRYPQLMTIRAKQMILKVGGHLMGIVLNNINMSQDENYYYYSGYYEYKSKQNDDPDVKGETASKKTTPAEIKQKY